MPRSHAVLLQSWSVIFAVMRVSFMMCKPKFHFPLAAGYYLYAPLIRLPNTYILVISRVGQPMSPHMAETPFPLWSPINPKVPTRACRGSWASLVLRTLFDEPGPRLYTVSVTKERARNARVVRWLGEIRRPPLSSHDRS